MRPGGLPVRRPTRRVAQAGGTLRLGGFKILVISARSPITRSTALSWPASPCTRQKGLQCAQCVSCGQPLDRRTSLMSVGYAHGIVSLPASHGGRQLYADDERFLGWALFARPPIRYTCHFSAPPD